MEIKEEETQQSPPPQWGTWEELLLSCAVKRHGFKDWDAVAMEVQSRTTLPHLLTTARTCEQKFHDLKRRFTAQCDDDVVSDPIPWLDELRKLRVAELKQDLQRYDVSILSLQLKVKKLEEERERSIKENVGRGEEKPDLETLKPENDKKTADENRPEPADSPPVGDNNNNKPDESDRENQSVNESNSTGSRSEEGKTGDEKDEKVEPTPVQTDLTEPEKNSKPVGEESNNDGSCDTTAKVETCQSQPPSEVRKAEENSSELRDSVAHSREGGGEVGTKESSEVQSSASLTRKRNTRRRKEVASENGGEDLLENDEKSQPLVGVLELIKGHDHGSLFQRRLESQESDKYKNTVRQHVDLETIQLRLRKGAYSSAPHAFFRDLLLLFTNAIVFFSKDSTESLAAHQLRTLISNEIKTHLPTRSDPTPRKSDPSPANPPQPKPDSLLSKPKSSSAPILVCRKRSSIPKLNTTGLGQNGDRLSNEKKSAPLTKPPAKPSSSDTDDEPPRKVEKEKPSVTGVRSLRRSNKNLANNSNLNKKIQPSSNQKPSGSDKNKTEASPSASAPDKKKSGAADFLKRIKRNAPAASDSLRGSGDGGGSSKGGSTSGKEQKKLNNNSGKGDQKGKERPSRNNNGGSSENKKNETENSSQSKRSVGRPPKKSAEASTVSGKRGRDNVGGGKDKRPKKRSRK